MLEIIRAVIEVYFSFGWTLGLVMFGRVTADDDNYAGAAIILVAVAVLWPWLVWNGLRKNWPEIQHKDEGL